MFQSTKNGFRYFFYTGLFLGACCLSTAWGQQAAVGSSSTNNEQIARGGEEGRGGSNRGGEYRGGENYNRGAENYRGGNTQHNVNQGVRHDTEQDMYRSDYNGHKYDGNYNYGSEFAPTYVAPVVPVQVEAPGYNTNGTVNPAYNVDPYGQM